MAQQVKLKARKRTLVGRNAIKQIKAKGLVPGVIYGSNQVPMPLEMDNRELSTVLARATPFQVSGTACITCSVEIFRADAGAGAYGQGQTFVDAAQGELLLYEDSVGFLAIAVNGGSAAATLALRPGQGVLIRTSPH